MNNLPFKSMNYSPKTSSSFLQMKDTPASLGSDGQVLSMTNGTLTFSDAPSGGIELVGETIKSTSDAVTSANTESVCIGYNVGRYSTSTRCVMIGKSAGESHGSGNHSVGVGYMAGQTINGNEVVCLGHTTGASCASKSVSLGARSGGNAGTAAISIGYRAFARGDNSIVINATGGNLIKTDDSCFFVDPVRNTGSNVRSGILTYNHDTKEIAYAKDMSFPVAFEDTVAVTGNDLTINVGGNSDKGFKLTSNSGQFLCGYLQESNNSGFLEVRGGVNAFNANIKVLLDGRNGAGWASWGFFTLSDDKIKSYETPITNAVDTLTLCQPKMYKKHAGYIIDAENETPDLSGVEWHEEYGLIAQELEAVGLNHFVKEAPNDTLKSVSYTEFIPVLIQAVKELSARIKVLEGV